MSMSKSKSNSNSNPIPLSTPTPSSALAILDYRKGNWTIEETLTLITAKGLDDERRAQPRSGGSASTPRSAAELRWKWIENYCCANGCMRSQNQCNDKWDNLLRDYKKLTCYQHQHSQQQQQQQPSVPNPKPYWEMDKQERKDKALPSNLSAEVFDALTDVMNRRSANRSNRRLLIPVALLTNSQQQQQQQQMEMAAEPTLAPAVPTPPAPHPPTSTYQAAPMPSQSYACPAGMSTESSDSEPAGTAEPDRRRRKVRDAGSSVVQGASIVARTLLACEEKREKRHRDLIELQERRLRAEVDRAETDRQGLAGLTSAVNSLSSAVHAFVSHRDSPSNGNAG